MKPSTTVVCLLAFAITAACSNDGGRSDAATSIAPPPTVDEAASTSSTVEASEASPAIRTAIDGVRVQRADLVLLAHDAMIDTADGTRRPVDGLPAQGEVRWAQRAGDTLVVTVDCLDCEPRPSVYVLEDGTDRAEHIADGVFVTPGTAGLWAKSYEEPGDSCGLALLDLAGELVRAGQPLDCDIQLVEETDLGLVAFSGQDWLLLDPTSLDVIVRWRSPSRLIAVVGNQTLNLDRHEFTLADVATGSSSSIAAPSSVGHAGYGIVSPDSRYVAIEYRDPSQFMDLWVLDLRTRDWIHAPSMPVRAFIKRDPPTWTSDGRLAVLGYFGDGPDLEHLVVLWRPGDAHLSLLDVTEDAWFIA